MSFKNDEKQKSPARRFLFVLGLFMFSLYLILGLAVIFWKDFPIEMAMTYRVAFGVLLIAYSFFRFVRLLKNN
ncbi:MAG TPA: hypothetical protein VEV16_01410 [Daejeonella sp.]|nr:hypothetical protein [Daejeonella sp.]